MPTKFLPFLLIASLALSCHPIIHTLKQGIGNSPEFSQSFTGLVLFDPETNKVLFDQNGSKYFTPASNTKLFTFYASNHLLADSISAFEYHMEGDTIWLWGTGDPSLLHPELPASTVIQFLKGKKVRLVRDAFREPVYGPGWAWDDYTGGYQREKASFPVYGNALNLQWDSVNQQLAVSPTLYRDSVSLVDSLPGQAREPGKNRFYFDKKSSSDTLNIPLKTSENMVSFLLSDTLHQPVEWATFQKPVNTRRFYSVARDSLLLPMLQDSDNFLAEQLILLCSWELFGELNSRRALQFLVDSLLDDLPHRPIWVDGSGLSRYNLFTPRTLVALLEKLYREVPEQRLFALLPAGGVSGTIKEHYRSSQPYIYAKTGTLRNNHALSGFLITRKGKRLIFSFMHNHFINGSTPTKEAMERILYQIHLKY